MNQSKLTNFFKFKSGKGPAGDNRPMKRQSLSLCQSVTPRVKKEVEEEETIVITSDEEGVEDTKNLPGSSIGSASSGSTIVYTPESPLKRLRNSFKYESPDISVKLELPSSAEVETSTDRSAKVTSTPYETTSSPDESVKVTPFRIKRSRSIVKATPSPSKKQKFYSPNKQRNVVLKQGQQTLNGFVISKKLFESDEDERYITACEGVDDKTKFLLKIVNDFLKDNSLKKLLHEDSVNILDNYLTIPKPGSKLICRLFWRKEGWYRHEEVKRIAAEEKNESIDEDTALLMLGALKDKGILLAGTENMNFKELTSVLLANELKEICKSLGIKTQTKKSAEEALADYCNRTSISSYFITSSKVSNKERVLQIMTQKAGACYRLSDVARRSLESLYRLTFLGLGFEPLREKRLELMLINEKIRRETFPVEPRVCLDNASIVFQSKDEFDRYLSAQEKYEKFLSTSDTQERCSIVREAYNEYNNLSAEHLLRYKSLPEWLRRFTPPYVYVKIIDEGLKDLKKGKVEKNCVQATDILRFLIEQSFRRHKRAEWYAEQALVLHTYLSRPDEAAQVLIRGFETALSEAAKDRMRPRARLLAQQKNIGLDCSVRRTLLAFADNTSILESNIPSYHIFKQPKENITKGKAMYETKYNNGRITQGVEEYACSDYILRGDFTDGHHWEGRIVTTIFFLLFWEVIYSPPRRGRGIFLSRLQRFPLDMFCEEFYANRKEAIDARLKFVEDSPLEELLGVMQGVWDGRPECELSGISRDVGWPAVKAVSECLGPRRLAALCLRLATDYRYAHSGFPDLTLWSAETKLIKFVEVKSDSDKPSVKQIQWMQYLRQHGVDTEFCYVGARTTHVKARRRPMKQSAPSSHED